MAEYLIARVINPSCIVGPHGSERLLLDIKTTFNNFEKTILWLGKMDLGYELLSVRQSN